MLHCRSGIAPFLSAPPGVFAEQALPPRQSSDSAAISQPRRALQATVPRDVVTFTS